MITEANISPYDNNNLIYVNEHKRIFQVESLYPLDIFEDFVQKAKGWGLECSCKVQNNKLYPARFNLFCNRPSVEEFDAVLNFFHQVEARNDVKLGYRLMQQFLGDDFECTKIKQILVGVDLRKELLASRVKFWLVIQDYPEKRETAIALSSTTEELRELISCTSLLVIGFDFFLNGSSTIELYPRILRDELEKVKVRQLLAKFISPPALQLLENCWAFALGFSKANPETILYYPTSEPDSFIPHLQNKLANSVHDYYRKQPIKATIFAFRESELLAKSVQNLNLYYQMSQSIL